MDPSSVAEIVFRWSRQRFGEQLLSTTIWDMWNEGSKWYVTARSRTKSNPRSADNPYETVEIDGATGDVVPRGRDGRCPNDGSFDLRYYSKDFLTFRYTMFNCPSLLEKEPKYRYFKEKFDEAAKLLRDNDHAKRVEGASIIVKLVEEGAGVIGPTPRTEWQGRAHYDTE